MDTLLETMLGYSQRLDVIAAIGIAAIMFFCRLKQKVIYGLIEVATGLYLTHFAFHATGNFSSDFSSDFDVFHLTVVITTYIGAIFVMVRGFDNIHTGWKSKLTK